MNKTRIEADCVEMSWLLSTVGKLLGRSQEEQAEALKHEIELIKEEEALEQTLEKIHASHTHGKIQSTVESSVVETDSGSEKPRRKAAPKKEVTETLTVPRATRTSRAPSRSVSRSVSPSRSRKAAPKKETLSVPRTTRAASRSVSPSRSRATSRATSASTSPRKTTRGRSTAKETVVTKTVTTTVEIVDIDTPKRGRGRPRQNEEATVSSAKKRTCTKTLKLTM